ncbi:putative ATP12 chaperone protein [Aspergillus campestris IBT 28561]|uniref:ATP12 chaperone protein n=1 Tax=Aspergillus campestris (strain IBT 28561) TaxID=1392248 RepID=A0A2I1CSR7_ASPC2|nr:putative ATP12 chaperone protein [Aspergillus campestris IBT 28561]PKY00657.1 putative ATP12 chaperone protein [Aspergillus campestris IBT 28561]
MLFLSRASPSLSLSVARTSRRAVSGRHFFHSPSSKAAIAHPVTAHGPPPKAPSPASGPEEKVTRQETPGPSQGRPIVPTRPDVSALKKRFWKNVDIQELPEKGEYRVLLDTRPVRTPQKDILSIPSTKPHLANAVALEWDVMTTAQQALKNHLIPLTSLTARAEDIVQEDKRGEHTTRDQIVETAMRYLETDTLLCWVPEQEAHLDEYDENGQKRESLRDAQVRIAKDTMAFLSTKVWPGVEIKPILDTNSIFPASQSQATKDIIQQWVRDLQPYDLAALERGVLAAKSLLVAVRLVTEWSENFRHFQQTRQKKFGIEEAAEACSLEVSWQTDMWGEVEDTHDVDNEDIRRQLGSVIVLVSGHAN